MAPGSLNLKKEAFSENIDECVEKNVPSDEESSNSA
jgi:hypothetical protein